MTRSLLIAVLTASSLVVLAQPAHAVSGGWGVLPPNPRAAADRSAKLAQVASQRGATRLQYTSAALLHTPVARTFPATPHVVPAGTQTAQAKVAPVASTVIPLNGYNVIPTRPGDGSRTVTSAPYAFPAGQASVNLLNRMRLQGPLGVQSMLNARTLGVRR